MAQRTAGHPPFMVGKPVTGAYFVNREEELKKLVILARGVLNQSSSNSILTGLRRTGKSSIQENLAIRLKPDKKIVPVIVSCYGISSKSRSAKLLSDKTVESYVSKTGDRSYWKRLKKGKENTRKNKRSDIFRAFNTPGRQGSRRRPLDRGSVAVHRVLGRGQEIILRHHA